MASSKWACSSMPPQPANESLTEVGISWEMTLESVDDANEHFAVELDLKYTWLAKGFGQQWEAAGRPQGAKLAELVDNCWDPKIRVANVVSEEEVSNFTQCFNPALGRMHRYTKMRIVCSEMLELHRFPFDRQLLAVHLSTFRDMSEVVFVPYENRPSLNKSRTARWKVYNHNDPLFIVPSVTSSGLIATSGRAYHKCFLVIEAERDANWYVLHFIIPHCVIIAMNANVIAINRNDVGDRNSVTLTLLLTAVAFQFLLVPEVPKKGYQTLLDWTMTIGLAVQLLTCALVFLNADNPHIASPTFYQFYPLTDEFVGFVEQCFLVFLIFPWVIGNMILVVVARSGAFAAVFDDLASSQHWLAHAVIGPDSFGPVPASGFTRHRLSAKGTRTVE